MGISLGFHQASAPLARCLKIHDPFWSILKRLFDIVGALAGMVLFGVAFAILCVPLSKGGGVFFSQTRIGRNGRKFRCSKFRSMYVDADVRLKMHLAQNLEAQDEWDQTAKLKDDPRITPLGNFLRRKSIDEFPQFWSVLIGEMSLVGPRPVPQEEMHHYGAYAYDYKSVKPGMSGLWQVSGRNDLDYSERVTLDVDYIHNWSLWLDIKIVLKTVLIVFTGRGAY